MRVDLDTSGDEPFLVLPSSLFEQAQLSGPVQVDVEAGKIVIRQAGSIREGWQEAAAECHQLGEDDLSEWDATTNDSEGML